MTNETLPTLPVANWFIGASKENGQEITAMKLQKLVYIAYGYCLALYGRPLVREQVAVWHWGPGFRGIYDFAGAFGSGPIPSCLSLLDGCPTLREDDPRISLLRLIWETHGKCSSSQLAQLVNETGGPWDETRRKYPDRDCVNIDDDLIMKDFKSKMQNSPTTVNTEPQNLDETVEKLKDMNDTLSRNAEISAANNESLGAMFDTLNSCHLIPKEDLLDTTAAALYLGVSQPGTIRNWLEGGSFPGAFQSRGQWFFPVVELAKVKRGMDEIQTKNKNRDLQLPDPSDDYDFWATYD